MKKRRNKKQPQFANNKRLSKTLTISKIVYYVSGTVSFVIGLILKLKLV